MTIKLNIVVMSDDGIYHESLNKVSELFVLVGLGTEYSDWDMYWTLKEKTSDMESSSLLVALRGVAPMCKAGAGDRRSVLTELM